MFDKLIIVFASSFIFFVSQNAEHIVSYYQDSSSNWQRSTQLRILSFWLQPLQLFWRRPFSKLVLPVKDNVYGANNKHRLWLWLAGWKHFSFLFDCPRFLTSQRKADLGDNDLQGRLPIFLQLFLQLFFWLGFPTKQFYFGFWLVTIFWTLKCVFHNVPPSHINS
jgi:hypothetical protein